MQLASWPIIPILLPFGLDVVMAGIAVKTVVLWPQSVMKAQAMFDMRLIDYLLSLWEPVPGTLAIVAWVLAAPLVWPGSATSIRAMT